MAAYRKAVNLQPEYAEAHVNLGVVLELQGDLSGAIAAYRNAIEYDPKFAMAFNNLGDALVASGDLTGAVAHFRHAVDLQPEYAGAWCGLGLALREQGQFEEGLAAMRRGHELGTARNWSQPSAEWVAQLERLVDLDRRLPRVAEVSTGISPQELGEFAQLCYYKRQYGRAATFWQHALADDDCATRPAVMVQRYDAACAAALAGCGQGLDDPLLDSAAQAAWRREAIEWLRANLAAIEAELPTADAAGRAAIVQTLAHWQSDRDLAGLRNEPALANLADADQAACRPLWAAVAKLLAQANQP